MHAVKCYSSVDKVCTVISIYCIEHSCFSWDALLHSVCIKYLFKWNSVLTTVYHLPPTLSLYVKWMRAACVTACLCVCVCLPLLICLHACVVSWCLVCLCVQWGEDGCSVSSNRAGWTGWLCQPPRSAGSASKQRKRNCTRKEVTRERKRGGELVWQVDEGAVCLIVESYAMKSWLAM